ncbi:AarF/ABC1/UbiB kinase family protein [Candidatus Woesearchaeota archaeon]|nr:AarF/ABC1/UbiB kinase family protein [Candidatus Woesearchaeota archaeon]
MNENLNRVKQVIRTLEKHGLAGALVRAGFAHYLPFLSRLKRGIPPNIPELMRKAMEELGGAYIKLGQMLSLRSDLIPQEYCDEFAKLLDEVPPESLETVKTVIEQEFKKPFQALYSHMDHKPLGSASVAQVHKARLKNGQPVAVKVQRPEVARQFTADIAILRIIAMRLEKHLPELRPTLILNEFEHYTKQELDFTTEARHVEEVRKSITTNDVVVPKVFETHTTKRVLTLQYLDGIKLNELSEKQKPHAAQVLIDSLLEQVFTTGVFHADLHPGNILILKNGKIGLLDFGIVGHIDSKTRKLGMQLYLAIVQRDSQGITDTLLTYGTPSSTTDVDAFKARVEGLLDEWWEHQNNRVTHLMHQLFILSTKHHLMLPRDTVLLGKALVTAEATARQLDSEFNYITQTQPTITKLLRKQRTPTKLIERFSKRAKLFFDATAELPVKTLAAVESIRQGRLSVMLKDSQFRHIGKDINRSSNRVSFALIAAALIMAGALMIDFGPKIGTYSVVSMVSYIFASLFVLLLLVSINREHHPKHDLHE